MTASLDPNLTLVLTILKAVALVVLSGVLAAAGDYQVHHDLSAAELVAVITVASIAVVQLGGAGAVAKLSALRSAPASVQTVPVGLDKLALANRAELASIVSKGYAAQPGGMLLVPAEDHQTLIRLAEGRVS